MDITTIGMRENPVSFNELKLIGRSAAHFKYFLENPQKPSKAMLLGSICHQEILGPPSGGAIQVFKGASRRGKDYDAFVAERPGVTVVTSAEYAEANDVLESLKCDELAAPWLVGRHEVELPAFERDGIWFRTRGIDVLGDGFVAELKTARSVEPSAFFSTISARAYHAQLRLYRDGAASLGLCSPIAQCVIVAAETAPPWPVIVVRLSEPVLDVGARILSKWVERLRTCRDSNAWPAYAQSVLDMPVPVQWGESEEEDENESEDA
jgi:hypothetical protein